MTDDNKRLLEEMVSRMKGMSPEEQVEFLREIGDIIEEFNRSAEGLLRKVRGEE